MRFFGFVKNDGNILLKMTKAPQKAALYLFYPFKLYIIGGDVKQVVAPLP